VIELLLLCLMNTEMQTVYNFDIYSGEKVEPSPLIQKILDGRKKSTIDYNYKNRPDFVMVTPLPIFDEDFKLTYYEYDPEYGYIVEREVYPYRNLYIDN